MPHLGWYQLQRPPDTVDLRLLSANFRQDCLSARWSWKAIRHSKELCKPFAGEPLIPHKNQRFSVLLLLKTQGLYGTCNILYCVCPAICWKLKTKLLLNEACPEHADVHWRTTKGCGTQNLKNKTLKHKILRNQQASQISTVIQLHWYVMLCTCCA